MTPAGTSRLVIELMQDFARQTGLDPPIPSPQRYLWTDAFAVCNYLTLFQRTHDTAYRDLALRLIDQVHHTLGQHRGDDPRRGWISGRSDQEGELHPTIGGLRIGKKLKERMPGEPRDDRLEWDRDGQYYHYLTKWMHALSRTGRITGDPVYTRWAVELAKTAHARFTWVPAFGGSKRMVWKMSIDLSYPLVTSMGLHDPIDGLVTYCELLAAAVPDPEQPPVPDLHAEIADMAELCQGQDWTTDDPLGIGGLLFDASRIVRLAGTGGCDYRGVLDDVVDSALRGLRTLGRSRLLALPARYRLAFRELGLSIGLKGIEGVSALIREDPGRFRSGRSLLRKVAQIEEYMPLATEIERFWLDAENRKAGTWTEHREINGVMLATSLAPDGFLSIEGSR